MNQSKKNKRFSELQGRDKKKAKRDFYRQIDTQNFANVNSKVIEVETFIESRSYEITAMQHAIKASRKNNNARGFQTLPRHLRRRAASHNVKRVPMRLRAKTIYENNNGLSSKNNLSSNKDSLMAVKKKKAPPIKNRQHRRKQRSLVEEYSRRQTGKRWLETHIWHTKRMKMVQKWGIMLDVSFMRTLQMTGDPALLTVLLNKISINKTPVDSEEYICGSRIIPLVIHQNECFTQSVGPAIGIWGPYDKSDHTQSNAESISTCMKKFWIRCHPSIFDQVMGLVEKLIHDYPDLKNIKISDMSLNIASLDIYGAESNNVISSILSTCDSNSNSNTGFDDSTSEKIWSALDLTSDASSIPEGIIIYLNPIDPRLRFPQKLKKNSKALLQDENEINEINKVSNELNVDIFMKNIQDHMSTQPQDFKFNQIWDIDYCKDLLAKKSSENDLNSRRHKALIPGSKLKFSESDITIPIMLIRKGSAQSLGSYDIYSGSKKKDNLADEQSMLEFESGVPSFPRDWPMTKSYTSHLLGEKNDCSDGILKPMFDSWELKPKSKKENFIKKGVMSPFYSPLYSLFGLDEPEEFIKYTFLKSAECKKIKNNIDIKVVSSNLNSEIDILKNPKISDIENCKAPWLLCSDVYIECLKEQFLDFKFYQKSITSFEKWIVDLNSMFLSKINSYSRSALVNSLENHEIYKNALIRVLLKPVGKGTPTPHASISFYKDINSESYENNQSTIDEPINKDIEKNLNNLTLSGNSTKKVSYPKKNDIFGYVLYGSYSYSESSGYAIGVCSLEGIFNLLKAQNIDTAIKHTQLSQNLSAIKNFNNATFLKPVVSVANVDAKIIRPYYLSIL
ncbi:hypothetical protein BB561_005597 [Smittium simulii]|uniref:Pop1 N-terminal domain-containing protein n=1 Tax=Smittium simulii TaxID=133385 RepID=A0A2T9Y9N0_9FUNG|nr:hypothetical protein BB561_005597 [Smittium simulii]